MVKLLISKDDIAQYYPTAVLDDNRINPFIQNAQLVNLTAFMGDALVWDLVNKYDDGTSPDYDKYKFLRNGGQYIDRRNNQSYFTGVTPVLVYYALASFVESNPTQITRFGVQTKTTDNSTTPDPQQVRKLIESLRSTALTFQLKVIDYLDYKRALYPLWNASDNASNSAPFNFFVA